MRVVIAGGHGKIAMRLEKLLAANGDTAVGIIRNPDHAAELRDVGAHPVVLDLERAEVDDVAEVLSGADVAVFSAGAGPGSGAVRKDTVDRAAAVLFARAAERAGVRRFVQVGSMGAGRPVDAEQVGEVSAAYLRAKAAAERDLRERELDWTILRPGRLTDEPGTGLVKLADEVERADVPRDDVAAVLLRLLADSATVGRTLELTSGNTPIEEAVARL
ncbi:NAD dependent epimerase/dehydratase family protein [Saccharomonospora marina XMU15]|uniref:NAD dependent epimerase/dehydratase family protein n=1 Tax=Saccharomonospora marina XMU15 TaxID=882083 RepID=H5X068_9PSEU|nr:NAD(P)H-binding protein [Saccharomonospora marina]EHR48528.1 NAD dependent epimerase/dehydratase family protein [Saccharomonospora marina XMU15]